MSSSVYLKSPRAISLAKWQTFCNKNGIVYSPNTIGRNVFYKGQVEITFGEPNFTKLPELESGSLDFSRATPGTSALEITVSSFFMSNLAEIAEVVGLIANQFPGMAWQAAPELSNLVYEIFKYEPVPESEIEQC